MDSLCHPWFTTANLSYRFPIFETSATALCGTTGRRYGGDHVQVQKSLPIAFASKVTRSTSHDTRKHRHIHIWYESILLLCWLHVLLRKSIPWKSFGLCQEFWMRSSERKCNTWPRQVAAILGWPSGSRKNRRGMGSPANQSGGRSANLRGQVSICN